MKAAIELIEIEIESWVKTRTEEKDIKPLRQALAVLEAWPRIKHIIDSEFDRIDKDERYHYEPALVQVNAPLALIQCEMGGEMFILKKLRACLESLPDKE